MNSNNKAYSSILKKYGWDANLSQFIKNKNKSLSLGEMLTAKVYTPTVIGFSGWVLASAMEAGLQRVYFLARDGYQFYCCAKEMAAKKNLPIEVRYLEVSRYSLRMPVFALIREEAFDYITLRGMDVNFYDMMLRAGISDEKEVQQIAKEIGYKRGLDEYIPLTEIPTYKEPLQKCGFFRMRLYENSNTAYDNAIAYLKQEGMFDDIPYAIADSGWTGTTQQTLQQLLNSRGYKRILSGYYFGMYDIPAGVDQSTYHSYFFHWEKDIKRKGHFSNSLFEAIFSSPKGMTLRYEPWTEEDLIKGQKSGLDVSEVIPGKYHAIYSSEKSPQCEQMEQQAVDIVKNTAIWCNNTPAFPSPEVFVKITPMLQEMYTRLMVHPSDKEAKLLGNYLFSDDVTDKRMKKMARDMSEDELNSGHILIKFWRLYVARRGIIKESAWYEGSAALCSKKAYLHQQASVRYKYLLAVRKDMERKRRA